MWLWRGVLECELAPLCSQLFSLCGIGFHLLTTANTLIYLLRMIMSPCILQQLSVLACFGRLFDNVPFSGSCYTPNVLQDTNFEGIWGILYKTSKSSCSPSKLLQDDWFMMKFIAYSSLLWLQLLYVKNEICRISLYFNELYLEILLNIRRLMFKTLLL